MYHFYDKRANAYCSLKVCLRDSFFTLSQEQRTQLQQHLKRKGFEVKQVKNATAVRNCYASPYNGVRVIYKRYS